jgi:recombinational DNA repair protein RecR
VLEPLLTLRLHFGPCLRRRRVGLQGQVVKVCTDSNSQAAVIVIDERKSRSYQMSTSFCYGVRVHLLDAELGPVIPISISVPAKEKTS